MSVHQNISEIHRNRVRDFEDLYGFITDEMHGFIKDNDDLDPSETAWIERMIVLFRDRFDKWEIEERDYLGCLYNTRRNAIFDLAALAHLHISYDLPIAIEQATRDIEKQFGIELAIGRSNMIYARIGKRIKQGMESRWQGKFKRSLKALQLVEFQGPMLSWVQERRQGAWVNFMNIRTATHSERLTFQDGLRQNMLASLEGAIDEKKTFWGRAFDLEVPVPFNSIISLAALAMSITVMFQSFGGAGIFGLGTSAIVLMARKYFLGRPLRQFERQLESLAVDED